MNYLDQWMFYPEVREDKKEKQEYYYSYVFGKNAMPSEGTAGVPCITVTRVAGTPTSNQMLDHLATVYYNKRALDNLKDHFHFKSDFDLFKENSLDKPVLPYYPLSV